MRVFQIIKSVYDLNNKLNFELNFNGLKEWVEPIKDKEVAVIATAGQTQTGKSFMLNLSGHHLSNKEIDEQIKGFESRGDVDHVTTGFWLSEPIIIQKDDGTELAVLLMDTQAVFDGNVEDSQRILWITLLMSSCLMINVLSNLNEEYLQKLEPFLQFMSSGTDSSNTSCAQSLIFLIRDWNRANLFKHGHKGGEQYLTNRLEIKEGSRAINTKRLIKNCFNEVDCYLFPGLGLTDEDQDFDGFMKTLSPAFIGCLQEMLAQRMGSNDLMPKEINNKCINGSDLCLYFKVYINLFNGNELPNHLAINSATTETFDLILINKIKDQHSIQLKSFISRNNSFVSRKDLTDYCREISIELKGYFEKQYKSKYPDVIQRLYYSLDKEFESNFDSICDKNVENRRKHIKTVLKHCEVLYKNQLENDFDDNHFFITQDLDNKYEENRKEARNIFRNSFNGEKEEMFAKESQQLDIIIIDLEDEFTTINKKRMAEADLKNREAIDESVDYYENEVYLLLASNHFPTDEEFLNQENEIKTKSRKIFLRKCTFGDSKFIANFDHLFRQRVSDLKYDFREMIRRNREKIIDDSEIDLIDNLDKIEELNASSISKEEFNQESWKLKEKFQDELRERNINQELAEKFMKKLDTKRTVLLKEFKLTVEKKKVKDDPAPILLQKAKNQYSKNMEALFNDLNNYQSEVLAEKNDKFKTKAITELRSSLQLKGKPSDSYVKELREFISEKYQEYSMKNSTHKEIMQRSLTEASQEYLKMYKTMMKASTEGSNISLSEYEERHKVVKSEVINSFESHELKGSDSFGSFLPKLEKMIEMSFEETVKPFHTSTELTDVRPNRCTQLSEVSSVEVYANFKGFSNFGSALNPYPFLGLCVNTLDALVNSRKKITISHPDQIISTLGQFLAKIIEITNDGKYQFNEQLLTSIVSKAKNCNNYALISIIGRKFSSKTFIMNCLKNFLESNERKSWPKNCRFEYGDGFHTDNTDYSLKPLIQMWSQPFIIESDEERTAVFLVDSSNVFNDSSEISNSGLVKDIISLFLNISSTVLFMTESDSLSKEIETLKSLIEESHDQTSKFQELICVLRDWNPSESEDKTYLFGPKSGERYLSQMNKMGKQELNKYFESLYCYLMPYAGSHYKRSSVDFDRLSDQFLVELSNLIRLKVLNIDEMTVKKDTNNDRVFNPNQLKRLFKNEVNKLNGISSMDLADLAESWQDIQPYDSGESIKVLDREDVMFSDDDLLSYLSD